MSTTPSFLFKLVSTEAGPRVFPWTGKNQYFALCESGFISFGGGCVYPIAGAAMADEEKVLGLLV